MENRDVVIIGTGPAGFTAGIYAARADLKPLIIEGSQPGGQLTMTTDVENFPGFHEGIMGPDLMENMRKQAQRFGTDFLIGTVTDVDTSKRPFKITIDNNNEILAQTLIIASGASARFLNLKNEKELMGKGVSACATCDGFFFRNKVVHVVGGGDTAIEEANFLSKFASKVYLVHRREELRASKAMQEKITNNEKIEMVWNSVVREIISDNNGVTGVIVENTKTKHKEERKTDGLFYAIGHTPNTSFLKGKIKLNEEGYIITKDRHPDTSIPGIFACGDVIDNYYRQAIIAAGSGCQGAMRAERYLEELGRA